MLRGCAALRVGHRQVLHDAAVTRGHQPECRRRGRELAGVLRGDLLRAVAVAGLPVAVTDRDRVGYVMGGDELQRLHHLRRRDLEGRVVGDLGVRGRRRDHDLRVGRHQVSRDHVQRQLARPGRAGPVAAQLDHAGRALLGQLARRVDRADLRVRQAQGLVELVDLLGDAGEVPALDHRHRGPGPVDALLPQRADAVVEHVHRAGRDLREVILHVVLVHQLQGRGQHLDLLLAGRQARRGGLRARGRVAGVRDRRAGDAGPHRAARRGGAGLRAGHWQVRHH